jgi:hypothetical protein
VLIYIYIYIYIYTQHYLSKKKKKRFCAINLGCYFVFHQNLWNKMPNRSLFKMCTVIVIMQLNPKLSLKSIDEAHALYHCMRAMRS